MRIVHFVPRFEFWYSFLRFYEIIADSLSATSGGMFVVDPIIKQQYTYRYS